MHERDTQTTEAARSLPIGPAGAHKPVVSRPNGGLLMTRADLDLAERSLPMVTIRVEKRYGPATVHSSVTAPSVEQALALAGEGARVVFPIDAELFFASAKANS
jgi:hypothetical protein